MSGRIVLRDLGKMYKRYPSRRSRLREWFSFSGKRFHEEVWVLRHIDLTIEPNESVGIVGQNGAGKSTLLKILVGACRANAGTCALEGRMSAILELGMGFHPDFTGYQNAVTACQILGHSNRQITELLPWIAEFSELEGYMDRTLRTYSSGMQIRLAFSIATAVRPDILIVDEALSVGDVYFQHKSMKRIREFKKKGTALLFVSHDPGAVKSLCDRAILLDRGQLIKDGQPDAILDYYNAMIAKKEADAEIKQITHSNGGVSTKSGSGQVRFTKVELLDNAQRTARAFQVGEAGFIRCHLRVNEVIEDLTVGFAIRDRLGNDIFGTNTHHLEESSLDGRPGEWQIEFKLRFNLGPGSYSVTVASHTGSVHLSGNHEWWDNAAVFQIVPHNGPRFVGSSWLPVQVSVRALSTA